MNDTSCNTQRTMPFLYQNAHIAGCLMGLFPLILFFMGFIGATWPFAVAGFYISGWVIGRKLVAKVHSPSFGLHSSPSTLLDVLDSTIEKAELGISMEARRTLNSIKSRVRELAPRMEAVPSLSHEMKILQRLVTQYLPVTLENYLRLPYDYAISHPLSTGKTAKVLLQDQLVLLDNHLKKMLTDTVAEDARAIVENGRFLEEKFKPYDFFNLK